MKRQFNKQFALKMGVLLLVTSILLSFSACVNADDTMPFETQETTLPSTGEEVVRPETEPKIDDVPELIFVGEYSNMPEVERYTDRLPDELKLYRSMLTEAQKRVYDLILPYVLTYTSFVIDAKDVERNGFTSDDLFDATRAILEDYPETWIYWSPGYRDFGPEIRLPDGTYTCEYLSFGCRFLSLHDGKPYNQAATMAHIDKLLKKAKAVVSQMPENLDTRGKYHWLAEYVCDITIYPDDTYDHESYYADGPLLYGKGVCQAYAFAYQLLCQEAGLWCILCYGDNHAWNVVKPDDGLTYYMDLTWQDATTRRDYYYFMSYEKCLATGHTLYDGEWIADGKDQ